MLKVGETFKKIASFSVTFFRIVDAQKQNNAPHAARKWLNPVSVIQRAGGLDNPD